MPLSDGCGTAHPSNPNAAGMAKGEVAGTITPSTPAPSPATTVKRRLKSIHFPFKCPSRAAPANIISAPNPGSQGTLPTPTSTPTTIAMVEERIAVGQLGSFSANQHRNEGHDNGQDFQAQFKDLLAKYGQGPTPLERLRLYWLRFCIPRRLPRLRPHR